VPQCTCEHCAPNPVRLDGPVEFGELGTQGEQGKRTDLSVAIEHMFAHGFDSMVREHPAVFVKFFKGLAALRDHSFPERNDPPNVNIMYGPPGCGKSHLARYGDDDPYWVDPLGSGVWFDGYDGVPKAIFDDFDGAMGHYRLKDFLKVTDAYTLRVPIKGGFVLWRPKTIQVTSNYHPRKWWDWAEREQQYPALQRRVTTVYHWRSDSERQNPFVITRDGTPDLWDAWWRGPQPGLHRQLGPLDDWVEQGSPEHPYDFIQSTEQ